MKKQIIFIVLTLTFAYNTYSIPPGAWLSQIFGRDCIVTWPPGGSSLNIGAGSGCSTPAPEGKCCNYYSEVCSSWLWGTKIEFFSQWGDCFSSDIENTIYPPLSGNAVYADMAQFWTENSAIAGVQNDWKDANILENNPSVLMASVVFRFQIAGYNCNSSWFTNAGVCNFAAAPTLEILVPLPPNQLDGCE